MNVLVTGNLGYNGPVLVRHLRSRGHFVAGLDAGFFLDNAFMPLRPYLPDEQLFMDVRKVNEEDLKGRGIEAIVHLAALSNDPLGEITPEQTMQINYEATRRLFSVAASCGVKRFVYASSCSTYGRLPDGAMAGETAALEPLTAYARSKALSEKFLSENKGSGLKASVLRYATMFGLSPMLRLDLVVNNLCAHAHVNREVTIMSDGTPWRPILHVADFAQITCRIMEDGIGGTYNVGFNEMNYRISEIGEEVSRQSGAPLKTNPAKTPDERSYRVDFSRISEATGCRPLFTLEKGIGELLSAYRKSGLTREELEGGKFERLPALKRMVDSGELSADLFWQKEGA